MLLTSVTLAAAQSIPPPPPPPQIDPTGANVRPHAQGPHTCQFSKGITPAGFKGTTTLSLRVSVLGDVTNVVVVESSGNTDVDNAAAACAADWKYQPARQGGVPIEATSMVRVNYSPVPFVDGSGISYAVHTCVFNPRPSVDDLVRAPKPTVVLVAISGGVVTGVTLPYLSGNADLDKRAVQCALNLPSNVLKEIPGNQKIGVPIFWDRG
jgi:TonB family protein